MDYYENWESFASNINAVPDQLDGERLMHMVSALSCTQAERESLGRAAAEGDKDSMERFINAYVPMIVVTMKKYSPRMGYPRDVLMNCVERVREKVADTLNLDNLEYNTEQYVLWITRNEVTHYIASQKRLPQEHPDCKNQDEPRHVTTDEWIENIRGLISDKDQAENIKNLLVTCKNDREKPLLALRFGLEDGVPKTLQETADILGISTERARQIQNKAVRRIVAYIREHISLDDSLNE